MAVQLLSGVGFSFLLSGVGGKFLSEKKFIEGPDLTFLKASLVGVSILFTSFLPHLIEKGDYYGLLDTDESFDDLKHYIAGKYLILSAAATVAIPWFANLSTTQGIAMALLGIGGGILGTRISLLANKSN